MKRLAHQGRANLGISTAGSLGVGCLPDVDLNLLEGLKCCNVVVTATKQRDDFFRRTARAEDRRQECGPCGTRPHQRGCASSVRDVSAHRSQMRAAWIGNENTLCDQPRKSFGNDQLDGAFRSVRIGWPNDLEKRCGQGSRIEHAILQEVSNVLSGHWNRQRTMPQMSKLNHLKSEYRTKILRVRRKNAARDWAAF
jgi:hypothetical protein